VRMVRVKHQHEALFDHEARQDGPTERIGRRSSHLRYFITGHENIVFLAYVRYTKALECQPDS
jgi:hypothetical protein